jgi:beta-lactamase class A
MASPTPGPLVIGVHHNDFAILDSQIDAIQQGSGARIGVSLIELGGAAPQTWSFNGDRQFAAASTYKLPVLMAEAQLISSRPTAANDALCYQASDWEDGWYEDYTPGMCFSRGTLSARIGQQSDNTAGHMLVRAMGGPAALNSYARAHGASESAFFVSNVTTANDLARLMADEARGNAGGPAAQAWLYPLLTRTAFETGIPAGIGGGAATVVHKVGLYDSVASDAGLIMGSPNGAYVLAVCSDGPGGDQGMAVVARVSAAVWQFESNVPR